MPVQTTLAQGLTGTTSHHLIERDVTAVAAEALDSSAVWRSLRAFFLEVSQEAFDGADDPTNEDGPRGPGPGNAGMWYPSVLCP